MAKIIKIESPKLENPPQKLSERSVLESVHQGLKDIDQLIKSHLSQNLSDMAARILIVEDEPMISDDLAFIVSEHGYVVAGQAYDGPEALDMIHNRQPDIVLLDISLDHQMSGLDVARHIRQKYHIPFIFITSHSHSEILHAAKELLPEGFIVKPFKQKDILATLEIVIHRNQHKNNHLPFLTAEELNTAFQTHITPKEYDIMTDLALGLSNESIAEKHFISRNTVKTHLKNIYAKVGIESRNQIASIMYRVT
jgi:DNA-binding NarL/FixJ family response regulator